MGCSSSSVWSTPNSGCDTCVTLLTSGTSPKAPPKQGRNLPGNIWWEEPILRWPTYRNTLQPAALAGSYLPKETLQTDLLAVWTVSNRRSGGLAPLVNHLLWADAVSGDQSCRCPPGLAPCASACLMKTAWINHKNNREAVPVWAGWGSHPQYSRYI